MGHSKKHPKTNTSSVSRSISYEAGLNTKIIYNKALDYIGHLKMTWQSSMASL